MCVGCDSIHVGVFKYVASVKYCSCVVVCHLLCHVSV